MNALRSGDPNPDLVDESISVAASESEKSDRTHSAKQKRGIHDNLFSHPELVKEQVLVDAIIDAIFYYEADRERIRKDPLVRLLISNPPGNYHFAIVTAMGVITEGKKGREMEAAFQRLKEKRDVVLIRADTGTARSLDYNAAKIEDAIRAASEMKRPYGLLGYSQGCANALQTESLLLSGTCRYIKTKSISRGIRLASNSPHVSPSQALPLSDRLFLIQILAWYAGSFYFQQRMVLCMVQLWISRFSV